MHLSCGTDTPQRLTLAPGGGRCTSGTHDSRVRCQREVCSGRWSRWHESVSASHLSAPFLSCATHDRSTPPPDVGEDHAPSPPADPLVAPSSPALRRRLTRFLPCDPSKRHCYCCGALPCIPSAATSACSRPFFVPSVSVTNRLQLHFCCHCVTRSPIICRRLNRSSYSQQRKVT